MRIDHLLNPFGIVKRFEIPYDNEQRFLEGIIYAREEEGLDYANWFDGEVKYRKKREIGGVQKDKFYQALKRGAPTQEEVEEKMRKWCESFGLKISAETKETIGVIKQVRPKVN